MYVKTKDLPVPIQAALHMVGYRAVDVALETRESVSVIDYGSEGRRAFVVLVDLAGERRTECHHGSWGGANMFNPSNPVDLDDQERKILPGMAVIKGSEGYKGTMATVYIAPENAVKILPSQAEVTAREHAILDTFGYISSYRKEQWREMAVTAEEFDALVSRGFVKRNAAGAMALTTEGKNARKGKS